MTNDFNDLDHNELGHEEVQQKQGVGANLAEAWRSRPLFKLMIIMVAVVAVVVVCITLFSGGTNNSNVSTLIHPPHMTEAPGGPVSPYMKQQTEMANDQRTQQALADNGSALPTPIGHSADIGDMSNSGGKSDQLKELEAEIQRQKQQIAQVQQQQAQPPQQPQQPQQQQFDDSLAQAMQKQMTQLMDSWTPRGIKEVSVTKIKQNTEESAATDTGTPNAAQSSSAATSTANNISTGSLQTPPKTIVPAGTVSYAQLLTEANSDVPGPILAQIVSGPLAGARAVGSFQVANGYSDYLVLQFNLASLKGKDYAMNGVALDPDTTLGGMATEVDQRYFTRVILPAAAGFLQGFGSSLGTGNSSIDTTTGSTIVTQSGHGVTQGLYTGLAQGAQTMSQFFQNQANLTKPLVRVAAGTPIGMFFVSTVVDQQQNQQYQGGYQGVAGNPGATGYGVGASPYGTGYGAGQTGYYPGSTLNGYGAQNGIGLPYPNQASSVPYPNYATTGTASLYPGVIGSTAGVNNGITPYGTSLYGH